MVVLVGLTAFVVIRRRPSSVVVSLSFVVRRPSSFVVVRGRSLSLCVVRRVVVLSYIVVRRSYRRRYYRQSSVTPSVVVVHRCSLRVAARCCSSAFVLRLH